MRVSCAEPLHARRCVECEQNKHSVGLQATISAPLLRALLPTKKRSVTLASLDVDVPAFALCSPTTQNHALDAHASAMDTKSWRAPRSKLMQFFQFNIRCQRSDRATGCPHFHVLACGSLQCQGTTCRLAAAAFSQLCGARPRML